MRCMFSKMMLEGLQCSIKDEPTQPLRFRIYHSLKRNERFVSVLFYLL
jgi:hypothetical protein